MKDDENVFFTVEYSAFYEDNFQQLGANYDKLYWTMEQMDQLYNIDVQKLKPNPSWNSIVHYSNLKDFRGVCKTFWHNNLTETDWKLSYLDQANKVKAKDFTTKKFEVLAGMVTRFNLKNNQQAEVMCAYIEHIYESMTLESKGGKFQMFLLTQFTAQNIEKVLDTTKLFIDNIIQQSFINYITKTKPKLDCKTILSAETSLEEEEITENCKDYVDQPLEFFLENLYDNCEHDSPKKPFKMSPTQSNHFCTSNDEVELGYTTLLGQLYIELAKIYNFGEETFSITKLSMMQLIFSTLTKNENQYLDQDKYSPADTLHSWDPETFTRPFEMTFFVQKFSLNEDFLNSLNLQKLTVMLNKASLFNPVLLYYTVVQARAGDFSFLKSFLGIEAQYFESLWKYLVLFYREFYLQGFFMNISEDDIENGIEVPFIRDTKELPILLGGDPTIMHPVKIKLQTATYVFEKFTGETNFDMLDNFYSMNGSTNITNSLPIFNGNVTSIHYSNPWNEDIPMSGCDNFCPGVTTPGTFKFDSSATLDNNKVGQESMKKEILREKQQISSAFTEDSQTLINVYGPPLNRTIKYNYVSTVTKDFMNINIQHYQLDQNQYKSNFPEYHQSQINGFFNFTSVLNFPIMVSQNHLHQVEEKISSKYKYFNKAGEAITASEVDGGFYETEERTHAVTRMNLNLHFNLEIKSDLLLFVGSESELDPLRTDKDSSIIVPLYNLNYWTSLDEPKFKNIFGAVSTANSFLHSYYTIFVTLFLVFLVLLGVVIFLWVRHENEKRKNNEYANHSGEEHLLKNEN